MTPNSWPLRHLQLMRRAATRSSGVAIVGGVICRLAEEDDGGGGQFTIREAGTTYVYSDINLAELRSRGFSPLKWARRIAASGQGRPCA